MKRLVAAFVLSTSLAPLAVGCGTYGSSPELLAQLATHENPAVAQNAMTRLRSMGPAGLDALMARLPDATPPSAALVAAIETVAAQKDAHYAGLYWHTDLDQARVWAQHEQKPILSLRLLGRLDDELSCANSRFFRTALYPDESVGTRLREKFVLHWESVRDVPKLTVDCGDGHRLVSTVTGNSAHLVLDEHGRLLDVVPGLYGPEAFTVQLERAEQLALSVRSLDDDELLATLARHHAGCLRRVNFFTATVDPQAPRQPVARALRADRLAMTKSMVERLPVTSVLTESPTPVSRDASWWNGISHLPPYRTELGPKTRRLMAEKLGCVVDDPAVDVVINRFAERVARDTAENELKLHAVVHRWFAQKEIAVNDLETCTRRVYAEVFASPLDDPWMGMMPEDAYTALPSRGVVGKSQ